MPRTRTIAIAESIETLRELEASTQGKMMRARMSMLRLLKEDPSLTLRQVAEAIGVSHHSVKQWWRWYVEHGLVRLREESLARTATPDAHLLNVLRDGIRSGAFRSLTQVRAWLGESSSTAARSERASGSPELFTQRALEFLSGLPHTGDLHKSTLIYSKALAQLFDDVDRVSVSINAHCNLDTPDTYRPGVAAEEFAGQHAVPIAVTPMDVPPSDRLLKSFRHRGFPFERYHEPVSFVYYYEGSAYLGCIFLWREREYPPISHRTLDLVNRLEQFIVFLLSDAIVRNRSARPISQAFIDMLDWVAKQYGLTRQEQRVLMLSATGATREKIAESMFISPNTVHTYLQAIYRKTGVHTFPELIARHMTPGNSPADPNPTDPK